MAASNTIKNSYGAGSIVISDGTGSPLTVTVDFDQGDFSISGLKDKLKDTTTYQSRGTLHAVRHTARTFPTISFTAMMSEFKDASGGTAIDMILGQAPFAARISTLGANADVTAFSVAFTIEGTDFGDGADHTVSFDDVEISVDFSESDPNTFSFSGTVYGAITGDMAIS